MEVMGASGHTRLLAGIYGCIHAVIDASCAMMAWLHG